MEAEPVPWAIEEAHYKQAPDATNEMHRDCTDWVVDVQALKPPTAVASEHAANKSSKRALPDANV